MTDLTPPAKRPANPRFSSGPCAKIPGYSLDMLADAPLGRSHRAAVGKAKLKDTQVEDAGRWFHHGKIVVVRSVDQAIALACWMKEMSSVIHMDAWSKRCPAEILKAA